MIADAEFEALSDEQALATIGEVGVIARVTPEHKVRLVDLLERQGHTVAMTGDGVNDAPALKRTVTLTSRLPEAGRNHPGEGDTASAGLEKAAGVTVRDPRPGCANDVGNKQPSQERSRGTTWKAAATASSSWRLSHCDHPGNPEAGQATG